MLNHRFINTKTLLIVIILLGAILRCYNFWQNSLSLDELATYWTISGNTFKDIIDKCINQLPQSPFYFFIVKLSSRIFGNNEFALRFPSIMGGIISIILIYVIGKNLFNTQVGLFSAFILAINSTHIFESQNARTYSIAVFLTLVSIWFLIKCFQTPSLKYMIGYVVFTSLILYTNYIFLLMLSFENLYFLYYWITRKHRKYNLKLISWIVCQLSIAALLIPVFSQLLRLYSRKHTLVWLQHVNKELLIYFFDPFVIFVTIFILITVIIIRRKTLEVKFPPTVREGESVLFLVAWYFIPISLAFIISRLFSLSIFRPRYLIIYSLAGYLIMGYFISLINTRYLKTTFIVLFFCIYSASHLVPDLLHYNQFSIHATKDWRGAIRYIEKNKHKSNLVLLRSGLIDADRIPFSEDRQLKELISSPFSGLYDSGSLSIINLTYSWDPIRFESYYADIEKKIFKNKTFWFLTLRQSKVDFFQRFMCWFRYITRGSYEEIPTDEFQGLHLKLFRTR